jgi:hypothetical protein
MGSAIATPTENRSSTPVSRRPRMWARSATVSMTARRGWIRSATVTPLVRAGPISTHRLVRSGQRLPRRSGRGDLVTPQIGPSTARREPDPYAPSVGPSTKITCTDLPPTVRARRVSGSAENSAPDRGVGASGRTVRIGVARIGCLDLSRRFSIDTVRAVTASTDPAGCGICGRPRDEQHAHEQPYGPASGNGQRREYVVVGVRGGIADVQRAGDTSTTHRTDAAMLAFQLKIAVSALTGRRFNCWVTPAEYGVFQSDFQLTED